MRRARLTYPLIALVAAAALVPAAASAKNLQAMRICGADACVDVPKDQLDIALVEGGSTALAPDRAEPWYRVRVTVGAGGAHDSWQLAALPRSGYFSSGRGAAHSWTSMPTATAAAYRRLTRGLAPIPAAQLPLRVASSGRSNRSAPAVAPADDRDGGHEVAVAGVVVGAVLLGAVAFSAWRRRRPPAA
jgi:hypothetical protein